jgi:hypothetical protein
VTQRKAVPWFTRKNYTAHRALDPTGLPATFDEWQSHADQYGGRELPGLRVVFNARQFAAWCRSERRLPDAAARLAFAQIVAADGRRRGWWQRKETPR